MLKHSMPRFVIRVNSTAWLTGSIKQPGRTCRLADANSFASIKTAELVIRALPPIDPAYKIEPVFKNTHAIRS